MSDMAHAAPRDAQQPAVKGRHQWVIWVIAAASGLELWGTWVGLAGLCGFPVAPVLAWRVPTNWTLAFTMEAYAGYAVFVWLGGAPGRASGRFAMWSALGALVLGFIGQGAYHLLLAAHVHRAPGWLVVFAACLPGLAVMLGGIIVHLAHSDSRKAEALAEAEAEAARLAAEERTAADERTALRRQLAALRDEAQAAIEAERAARDTALRQAQEAAQAAAESAGQASAMAARQAEADEGLAGLRAAVSALEEARDTAEAALAQAEQRAEAAEAKAERLSRKLGANSGAGGNRNAVPKDAAKSRTTVPNDVDARAQALAILAAEPGITGKELGERCGRGERWGQLRKSELAAHVADGGGSTPDGSE